MWTPQSLANSSMNINVFPLLLDAYLWSTCHRLKIDLTVCYCEFRRRVVCFLLAVSGWNKQQRRHPDTSSGSCAVSLAEKTTTCRFSIPMRSSLYVTYSSNTVKLRAFTVSAFTVSLRLLEVAQFDLPSLPTKYLNTYQKCTEERENFLNFNSKPSIPNPVFNLMSCSQSAFNLSKQNKFVDLCDKFVWFLLWGKLYIESWNQLKFAFPFSKHPESLPHRANF